MTIRLSPKHGLNPAIPLCFFCGKEKNEVIIAGRMRKRGDLSSDVEAPRKAVWDKKPCDECAALMKKGCMLISVRDGESGDNPYRTGRVVVITDDGIRRAVQPAELADSIIKQRVAFVPDSAWAILVGPLEGEKEAKT